jgi:hypothetical protein
MLLSLKNLSNSNNSSKFLSIEIWIALICFYAMVIPQIDYVPIWDSMGFLDRYLFLSRDHFSFSTFWFTNSGHMSLGYYWPFWIGQLLFPGQILIVHIINLLIGTLAIIAFEKTVTNVFHVSASRLEITLITIAFSVHPVFIAYTINISPDYGVLTYFLCTLWLLYSRRFGWAAITGIFLTFSKEIGIAAYLCLVICFLLMVKEKYNWKTLWLLVIPIMVFLTYCIYQWIHHQPIAPYIPLLKATEGIEISWKNYIPNPFTIFVKMVGLSIFVLNFQWIFTIIILIGLSWGILAKWYSVNDKVNIYKLLQGITVPFRFFILLLLGCFYIVSRSFPYTNQRWLLVLYPLFLLSFFSAIIQLNLKKTIRTTLLMSSVFLFLFCNFRTLDPISKKIFGTFAFGTHPMLKMTSITNENIHYGQDQLEYNLEHRYIPYLLDMAMAEIQPNNQTTIVMGGNWYLINRLNPKNYHSTASVKPPFIKPIVLNAYFGDINQNTLDVDKIYAVLLPFFDNSSMVNTLNTWFQLKKRHKFVKDGYELEVLEMTKKL